MTRIAGHVNTTVDSVLWQLTKIRPRISPGDRVLWFWIARPWSEWRAALAFVQTGTVIARQSKRFRDHWSGLSQRDRTGRSPVSREIMALVRKMSAANVGWGSPRIVGGRANSTLMLLKQRRRSTGCDPGNRRRRRGRLFWTIMSGSWCLSISSWCQP
jgi:hypothetical protein